MNQGSSNLLDILDELKRSERPSRVPTEGLDGSFVDQYTEVARRRDQLKDNLKQSLLKAEVAKGNRGGCGDIGDPDYYLKEAERYAEELKKVQKDEEAAERGYRKILERG